MAKNFKNYEVPTDKTFSVSIHRRQVTSKARRLLTIIKKAFVELSMSAFIPLYNTLVRSHLKDTTRVDSPNLPADFIHLAQFHRFAMRPDLYPVNRRRLCDDLIVAYNIFDGELDLAGAFLDSHPSLYKPWNSYYLPRNYRFRHHV